MPSRFIKFQVRSQLTVRATRSIVFSVPQLPTKEVSCQDCLHVHRKPDDGRWFTCDNCRATLDPTGQSFSN